MDHILNNLSWTFHRGRHLPSPALFNKYQIQQAEGTQGAKSHLFCLSCFLCSASSCSRRNIFSCFFSSFRERDDTLRANSLCFSSFSLCKHERNRGVRISPSVSSSFMCRYHNGSALFCSGYLLVRVIIGVDVVVKFLVFGVLLVTKLTVEVCSQIFQSLCNGFLLFHLVLILVRSKIWIQTHFYDNTVTP